MLQNEEEVYFVYSREQATRLEKANTVAGHRSPKFGRVIVSGIPRMYTDVVTNINTFPFADLQIVTKGYKSKMSFTEPDF